METQPPWTMGAGLDDKLPLPLYQSFSACLLAMGEQARRAEPEFFLREALLQLREIVGFDSAWWGEIAAGDDKQPPKNLLHASIGLTISFAEEWNRTLAPMDSFAQESMARLGTVFRASGGYRGPSREVASFIDHHGLHAIMAVTLELPDSGLLFFVSLYRNNPDAGFSDVESVLFLEFTRHLVQHWRHSLSDLHEATSAASLDSFALSDRQGRLFYLGRKLGMALDRSDSGWQGSMLPDHLLDAFMRAPCSLQLGRAKLLVEPAGKLLGVVLVDERSPRSMLPPRELSAATLYAQGYSYKEIARLLCLSPATVRTYLRDAYLTLGVTNKVELISALGTTRA